MDVETKRILLQVTALLLEQQHINGALCQNDMRFIESSDVSLGPEARIAAASTVRESAYSVDELADRLQQVVRELEHL
ncbi:MAG TPA: hypothetical protein VFA68_07485 [Terriglobales bacterium]|nr:hypothetical protein [Terriglobales bacterium]